MNTRAGAECHQPAPQPGARDMRGIGAIMRAGRTGICPRQPANTNLTCHGQGCKTVALCSLATDESRLDGYAG
jgi:hypothetical protein